MPKSDQTPPEDITEQVEVRWQKLAKLRESGYALYPNDFRPSHATAEILSTYGGLSDEQLGTSPAGVRLAGRIMGIRSFGKASFFHIQDRRGRLSGFSRPEKNGEEG